jgi:hypothetical protein
MGKKQLKRMAERMVKRAGLEGEEGVTVSFGFRSLAAALWISLLESIPYLGGLLTYVTFGLHRIVLVTDQHVYVFRARPWHRPGEVVATYPLGAETVTRVRGKLTFSDGLVVWHSPLFAGRAQRIIDAATAQVPA